MVSYVFCQLWQTLNPCFSTRLNNLLISLVRDTYWFSSNWVMNPYLCCGITRRTHWSHLFEHLKHCKKGVGFILFFKSLNLKLGIYNCSYYFFQKTCICLSELYIASSIDIKVDTVVQPIQAIDCPVPCFIIDAKK